MMYILDDSLAVFGLPVSSVISAASLVREEVIQPLGWVMGGITLAGLGVNYLVARANAVKRKEMKRHEVVKYTGPVRILHWVHTAAFVTLFLTGLVLFIPPLGFLAADSLTRIIHRVAAVLFVAGPLVHLVADWKRSWRGVGIAFIWGSEDIEWLRAAPRYYFTGEEESMPPQGSMNTGQKMWWFITLLSGVVFVITGFIMWFFKTSAPVELLQWMVLLHDISFIVSGTMLFVHIYLGVFHPVMTEAWRSMASGKISAEYAESHHAKWYREISGTEEGKPGGTGNKNNKGSGAG